MCVCETRTSNRFVPCYISQRLWNCSSINGEVPVQIDDDADVEQIDPHCIQNCSQVTTMSISVVSAARDAFSKHFGHLHLLKNMEAI